MKQFSCRRCEPEKNFVGPGHGYVPAVPTRLWSVIGSGIAITLFDSRRRVGGMTHYSKPIREPGRTSTAVYAAPAILWLIGQMTQMGSRKCDLEAQLFGGAVNPNDADHVDGISEKNVKVGLEILEHAGIEVGSVDVGGKRGRKVMFNSETGETAVLRVAQIRSDDWYPSEITAG